MPERPLLILPSPGEPLPRRRRGGGGGAPHLPSLVRQAERLDPKFDALQQALEARRVRVQAESHDLVPEEVVVLETIDTVEHFIRAVEKIPGMEWLAEIEETDIPPDDDFFEVTDSGERRPDKTLRGRLFMLFTNQDALRIVLSMWKEWHENGRLPRGRGAWKRVFERLRDVRLWGVKDRLHETGVLDDWRERTARGEEVVPCEIELWHRGTHPQRRDARDRVAALVAEHGGRIVTEATINEIAYHALLAHLPVTFVDSLLEENDDDVALVQCEQIQFFRASGQSAVTVSDDHREEDRAALPGEPPAGSPVIALFDGLPLQAHRRLQGRLLIDDPDDFEEDYPPDRRRHGTAMASLIVHGDLAAGEAPLSRPLYIRPILRPDQRDWRNNDESVPEDTLVVDLVHRAVRRLFEDEGEGTATAPSVAVINLSIGIRDRPFDQALSPLARLLDWLAWHYKVLFVVSAGNHTQRIELSVQTRDLESMSAPEIQRDVVRSVAADARHRRLLSPAEAVNALTVAAVHHDASTGNPPPRQRDPYLATGLPSPVNAQGMGYRRAIKPDILASGGRVVMREQLTTRDERARLDIYGGTLAPGQRVAAPGSTPGDLAAAKYTRGTSNAAAMVSRAAGSLYEVLEELRHDPGGEMIDTVPRAVWVKALIAHGADWGTVAETLRTMFSDGDRARFREQVDTLAGIRRRGYEPRARVHGQSGNHTRCGLAERRSVPRASLSVGAVTERLARSSPAHDQPCMAFSGESEASRVATRSALVFASHGGTGRCAATGGLASRSAEHRATRDTGRREFPRLRGRRDSGDSSELPGGCRRPGGRGAVRACRDRRSDERSLGLQHLRRSTCSRTSCAAARRRGARRSVVMAAT